MGLCSLPVVWSRLNHGRAYGNLLQKDLYQHAVPPRATAISPLAPRQASVNAHLRQRLPHTHTQRHHFSDNSTYSQSYGFSTSHVQMWELDHKEGWALKNWSFQVVGLEKTLKSPLDCEEIELVNPKGFIGRTDSEAEAPILWPPRWEELVDSLEKTLMLRKMKGKKRRVWQRMELLNSIKESVSIREQPLGDSVGQGSLVCCSPWDPRKKCRA